MVADVLRGLRASTDRTGSAAKNPLRSSAWVSYQPVKLKGGSGSSSWLEWVTVKDVEQWVACRAKIVAAFAPYATDVVMYTIPEGGVIHPPHAMYFEAAG